MLGTDPTPWVDQSAIDQALGGGAPLNMNVQQFLALPRAQQRAILQGWENTHGTNMGMAQGEDPNAPHLASTLPAKLWYAAGEDARNRYLEPDPG
jgi:hypothetical protein